MIETVTVATAVFVFNELPMPDAQDPLAIIGILGIFFPFILLGIAIATGYVDLSNYR